MARIFTFSICATLIAAPAFAGQPIYKSMAECGAIYAASAELIHSKPLKTRLVNASDLWQSAAVSAVTRAKMPDATSYVAMMHAENLRKWRAKGTRVAFSQDYRDWTAYCRSLAKASGIKLPAE